MRYGLIKILCERKVYEALEQMRTLSYMYIWVLLALCSIYSPCNFLDVTKKLQCNRVDVKCQDAHVNKKML